MINPNTTEVLKVEVAKTMCTLENVFPHTCFDVISHIIFHFMEELDMCGPVHTQWMYPMERYMKALKKYMLNIKHDHK
jgi:hypothetical protein